MIQPWVFSPVSSRVLGVAAAVCTLLAGSIFGAWFLWPASHPTISLPDEIRVPVRYPFAVSPETDGQHVQWEVPVGVRENTGFLAKPGSRIFEADAPGRYVFRCWSARGNYPSNLATCTVTAGDVPPGPGPQPVPPGPSPPGPQPTPPGPTPIPIPQPVTGLRVLFVYETSELGKLTKAQDQVRAAAVVLAYLKAKCAPNGFHFWDRDVDPKDEPQPWPAIWAALKPALPATPSMAVIKDQSIQVFPWPAGIDEALATLKTFEKR